MNGTIPQASRQTPGMTCPKCGRFIPTSINELISAQCLWCPHCGLKLTIDRGRSQKAIDALKKVEEAQHNVTKTSQRFK